MERIALDRGPLLKYYGLDPESRMKDILTSGTIAAITVVLLLVTGMGTTTFITPSYAPEPARLTPDEPPKPPSLTGVWHGNDGGTYYLRQIGNVVWWIGLNSGNDGRIYSNIFKGTITTLAPYRDVIEGEWVDVPRGTVMNYGKLIVDIEMGATSSYLSKISGAFGTTIWTRVDAPNTTPDTKPPFSLTGVWQASDGGTYYLRHIGYNLLWWNGMSGGNDGRTFNNVFKGEIKWIFSRILGEWIDVPRGTHLHSGTLDLRITSPTTLQVVSQTGGFSATTWQKVR